jgi:hypothetical protein
MAVYAFELGNIFYSQGDLKSAHRYLRFSVKGRFNVEASEFLLGKIDLQRNYWFESREHFEAASQAAPFQTASKLYIAQAYSKENRVIDALGAYVDAKESALTDVASGEVVSEQAITLAQQVLKTSEQELRSYSKSEWVGEVGIATSYDSNVLFMPNMGDANLKSTGSSVKQTTHWRLRYASDPTRSLQYLGSYQGSINYNFNQDTQGGQFLIQDFSNFVTKGFLKTTNYGFKLGTTGIMQYQTNAYKPFSLAGSVGPFVKTKLNDDWLIGFEAFFQPVHNFLDPSLGESARRSGFDQLVRTSVSSRRDNIYWKPSVFLTGTIMRPSGSDFSGTRLNLDFTNAMYLSSTFFVSQILGFSASRYPGRSNGQRDDQGFSITVSGGYQVSQSLALLAQMDYGQNFSSDSNFRYNRWSTTLSGNYRF